MLIARTLDQLDTMTRTLRAERGRLGFVPTMGALHDGHLTLLKAGQDEGLAMCASIFVNPTQFGPNEDLSVYPRDEAGDIAKLKGAGCKLLWLPDVEAMYPQGTATIDFKLGRLADVFEGAIRPGHFAGVATVVTTLLHQISPSIAYFGEKDWQQLQVVQRVIADMTLPYIIRGIPTVREADGLALSSRNRNLSPGERRIAPQLYQALQAAAQALHHGESARHTLATGKETLRQAGFDVNYFALVDGPTLQDIETVKLGARLIAAARLGTVRLLDNLAV